MNLFSRVLLTLVLICTAPGRTAFAQDGWIDILRNAGPELKGWVRGPIPPTGKLDAKTQWSIDPVTGYLVCDGKGGHDWLRYDKELSDFEFHVEFRYTAVPGKSGYNSGIYVRNSSDAEIWHQAQIGDASGGYLFGESMTDGKKKFFSFNNQVKGKPVKPAGEWNTVEFRCQGKDVTLTINGVKTCDWHDCQVASGYVGVEAEGYRIEFRNVKVKPLGKASGEK
jgi:hypothetical protein